MQFERKKQLIGLGALVFGLALAGCGGGGGGPAPSNIPLITVNSTLSLSTGIAAANTQDGNFVSFGPGTRNAYLPTGAGNVVAGEELAVVDGLGGVLPGLRAEEGAKDVLLVIGEGTNENDDSTSDKVVDTGLVLDEGGNITVDGSVGLSRGDAVQVGLPNGRYRFRIPGPISISNGGSSRLTIRRYFQFEFRVVSGVAILPSTLNGSVPANGSPAVVNGVGLKLQTGGFPASTSNFESISLDTDGLINGFEREQNQQINGGTATFKFQDQSTFQVPRRGLERVIYRANRPF